MFLINPMDSKHLSPFHIFFLKWIQLLLYLNSLIWTQGLQSDTYLDDWNWQPTDLGCLCHQGSRKFLHFCRQLQKSRRRGPPYPSGGFYWDLSMLQKRTNSSQTHSYISCYSLLFQTYEGYSPILRISITLSAERSSVLSPEINKLAWLASHGQRSLATRRGLRVVLRQPWLANHASLLISGERMLDLSADKVIEIRKIGEYRLCQM